MAAALQVLAKRGNRYLVQINGDCMTARVVIVHGREVQWLPGCMPVGSYIKHGHWYEVGAQETMEIEETILESLR